MKKIIFCILALFSVSGFAQTFDIEGHRGARGYVPENTIPSFIKALETGADTIELDVVMSRDGKVVVSHEPWFSHVIALDQNGNAITEDKEKDFKIYTLDYAEIKKFDVGSIGNKAFPEQVKMKVYKPLLSEVFKEVGKYARKNNIKNLRFNIEIKSNPQWDNIFTPTPNVFAKAVYDEIIKAKMQNNVIVQSFDPRSLQELRKLPVKLPVSFLVGNKDGIEKNLALLGFQPDIYSPHFSLIDEATVKYAKERGMKIIPWTVNEIADLERMKTFDLDGIITDYPDRAVKIFRK